MCIYVIIYILLIDCCTGTSMLIRVQAGREGEMMHKEWPAFIFRVLVMLPTHRVACQIEYVASDGMHTTYVHTYVYAYTYVHIRIHICIYNVI